MNDVVANSPLKYTHADLRQNGYIILKDKRGWGGRDFHRDMTLNQFPDAPLFDSLKDAIKELPAFDGGNIRDGFRG